MKGLVVAGDRGEYQNQMGSKRGHCHGVQFEGGGKGVGGTWFQEWV